MKVAITAGLKSRYALDPSWGFSEERSHCESILEGAKPRAEGPGQYQARTLNPEILPNDSVNMSCNRIFVLRMGCDKWWGRYFESYNRLNSSRLKVSVTPD